MEELRIVIGIIIYTGVIIIVYRPIWLIIGIYPLRFINKIIDKLFISNNKSELTNSITKYIWCTSALIWIVYFVTPTLSRILSANQFTILFSHFKYSILLYALISMLKTFTPNIIESNKKLSSALKFISWSSALLICLLA